MGMSSSSRMYSARAHTEAYPPSHIGLQGTARWNQNGMRSQGPIKKTKYSTIYLVDQDEYLKNALFSEIQILQLLKSENVVRVLDVM